MFKKRILSDKQILVLIKVLKTSKKFFVFLALAGQLISIFPSQKLQAVDNNINQETIPIELNEYQSDELDVSLVPMVHMKSQSTIMKSTIWKTVSG